MTNKKINLPESEDSSQVTPSTDVSSVPTKGPLSFISGSFTILVFALLSFMLSKRMVIYFTLHSPTYKSPIAQSIASGLKTLLIGITFLATFSFAFIGFGLFLVFIRSLFVGNQLDSE